MVGAIADWFAVTALFKHPLGLPIPHTALIPRRKEMLGRSLEEFVGENFLHEQVIRERLQVAELGRRVGEWLVVEEQARRVVDEAATVLHIGLARVRDDDLAAVVAEALLPRLLDEPISPVAGSLLAEVVRDKAHHGLVDLVLDEALPVARPERGHLRRDRRRAGSVVVAARRQRPRHPPDARRAAGLDLRDPQRPRAPRPGRARRDAATAGRGPAATTRPPRPAPRRSRSGCSTTPRSWSPPPRCGTPSGPPCSTPSPTTTAPLRRRAVDELAGFGRRLLDDDALRARLDRYAADLAVFVVDRYGAELTDRHHPHHRPLGRPGGGPQDRAARRSRPAVHPDQRHDRRRPGRRTDPHRRRLF